MLLAREAVEFIQRYEIAKRDFWGKFTSVPSLAVTLEVNTSIGEWTVFNSHLLISRRMKGIESGESSAQFNLVLEIFFSSSEGPCLLSLANSCLIIKAGTHLSTHGDRLA